MLPKFSVKKPFTILVCVLLVVILGVVAYGKMTPDLLPSIDMPYVVVVTSYAGASPEQVESTVTKPIEQAMARLDGIESIKSTSSENMSMVILQFSEDSNMDSVTMNMRESLSSLSGAWDEYVSTPTILKINPDMLPVGVVAVSRDGCDAKQLSSWLESELLPQLEGTDGVASIQTSGMIEQQLSVNITDEKLADVNARIQEAINQQFDDAEQKLLDAKQQLADGRAEISDKQQEMEKGQSEIGSAQAQLDQQMTAAEDQLKQKQAEVASGRQQINDAIEEIQTQLATVEATETQLRETQSAAAQLQSSIAQLQTTIAQLQSLQNNSTQLESARAALVQSAMAEGRTEAEAVEYLRENSAEFQQIEAGLAQIDTALAAYSTTRAALAETIAALQAQLTQAQTALAQIENGLAAMNLTLSDIPAKLTELETAKTAANSALSQMRESLAQLDQGAITIEQALEKLPAQKSEAQTKINTAIAEMAVGKSQLQSALQDMDTSEEQLEKSLEELPEQRAAALESADVTGKLDMKTVSALLSAQNFSMPAGYVQNDGEQILVRVGDVFGSEDEVANLVLFDTGLDDVGCITLSDIAEVSITDNSADVYARMNGQDGVVLSFSKQSNYATAVVSENIQNKLEALADTYEGLHFTSLMDQGNYIHLVVNSVLENLILGAVLAVLILFLFLRDYKPTIVVACSIPISVTFAIVLMYFSGVTLNIISMAGLAVGVGMLVDNSIVVIENIYRLRASGVSAVRAAVNGAVQVTGAITASTLTTICVFAPIIFVQGLTRQLFTDMALTISYSLLASLLVALTLVPTMGSAMLRKVQPKESRFFEKMKAGYGKLLEKALNKKAFALLLALLLLGGSAALTLSQGFTYFPDMSSTQVSITLTMPEGATTEETRQMADEASDRILTIDGVDTVGAMFATSLVSSFSGGASSGEHTSATLYAILSENSKLTSLSLAEKVNAACADLDCTIDASGSSSMTSMVNALGGSGVQIDLYANDLDALRSAASLVAEKLGTVSGVTNINDGLDDSTKTLEITVDKNKAMQNGLTVAQVYQQLAAAVTKEQTATELKSDNSISIVLSSEKAEKLTADDIRAYTFEVTGKDGESSEVALRDIADISEGASLASISRVEQKRYLSVTADVEEGKNVTLVSGDVQKAFEGFELPDGVTMEYSGENESILDAMWDLLQMLLLGVVIVYLIMVAQFQSLKSPFIVMFTIPLAFTGGFLALWLCGYTLSILSMIGMIMLVGIVVNNGIVLIDAINQLRVSGMERRQAIREACMMRLRPVLMTALTTILGLMPLALGIGMGAELMQPVAVVCIGGLLYATLTTLLLIPAVYDWVNKKPPRVVSEEELAEIQET